MGLQNAGECSGDIKRYRALRRGNDGERWSSLLLGGDRVKDITTSCDLDSFEYKLKEIRFEDLDGSRDI